MRTIYLLISMISPNQYWLGMSSLCLTEQQQAYMAHLRSWVVLTLHKFYENTGLKSMDVWDICPYSHGTSAHRLFILMIVRYP